ncbi:4-oxalocrotonate tautomerase [Escherichia coli]|nr:4-oxalocrotonate tautomerase [Escherichia coli]
MPHIDIKCFPRELDEQQKAALAADITDVIIRHLNSKDSSISIALQQIQPALLYSRFNQNLGKLSGMPKSRPKWRL